MELPKKCRERILQLNPCNGSKIIKKCENLIDFVVQKYNLSNVRIMNNMSYNIIVNAYNNNMNDVIVKIGIDDEAIKREIEFYKIYCENTNLCEVYFSDLKMGYLIMKKASANMKLDDVKSFDKRITIYKNIYNSFDKKSQNGIKLPQYYDIFMKSIQNFNKQIIQKNIEISKVFLLEIKKEKLPKYILHGDLHHWNIILDGNTWKAIDPVRLRCM